ncbi:TetR family transcriptional regulator [Pseudomonas monteilii]|uniref:TetR family transcriptional regulator n=1 Tax=Pseudomonas monteilii TaxID=76759 RepID=UPI003D990118
MLELLISAFSAHLTTPEDRWVSMARKTLEDAAKTRQDIIDAAVKVFACYGISEATLEQVAKAAGVSRGAVYWYFKGKKDLVKTILSELDHPLGIELGTDVRLDLAWEKMITALIDAISTDQSRRLSKIMVNNGALVTDGARKGFEESVKSFAEHFSCVLEQAVGRGELPTALDRGLVTEMFRAWVTGLLYEGVNDTTQSVRMIIATMHSIRSLINDPPAHLLRLRQ